MEESEKLDVEEYYRQQSYWHKVQPPIHCSGLTAHVACRFRKFLECKGIKGKGLVVGAGCGAELETLDSLEGCCLVAIDIIKERIEALVRKGWDVLRCDMHSMDVFVDNSFDFVFANHVLEHAYDLKTVVKELYRVAKPGAYLCTGVPIPCVKKEAHFTEIQTEKDFLYYFNNKFLALKRFKDKRDNTVIHILQSVKGGCVTNKWLDRLYIAWIRRIRIGKSVHRITH